MRSQGRTIAESPTESQRGGVADPDPAARRVSVILPVRDGHATIDEALGSLVAQTHRRLEVVVVDDGSRDATPSILGRWVRRDPRIRVVRTQRRGLVAALQRGLAEAEGEFVARMDADDIAHPARLAAQLAFLTHNPELSGCGARVRRIPAGDITPRAAAYIAWLNAMTDWKTVAANLFVECPLAHPPFSSGPGRSPRSGGTATGAGPRTTICSCVSGAVDTALRPRPTPCSTGATAQAASAAPLRPIR